MQYARSPQDASSNPGRKARNNTQKNADFGIVYCTCREDAVLAGLVILRLESLGGRLMVRLQTLDLRIGVRVPASQPLIRQNLAAFAGIMCDGQVPADIPVV